MATLVDWGVLLGGGGGGGPAPVPPFFEGVKPAVAAVAAPAPVVAKEAGAARTSTAKPRKAPAPRPPAITEAAVTDAVRSVLGGGGASPSASTLGPDTPLTEAGLDSLGAVELRNALAARFGAPGLASTVAYDHPTVTELVFHLRAVVGGGKEEEEEEEEEVEEVVEAAPAVLPPPPPSPPPPQPRPTPSLAVVEPTFPPIL